VEEVQRHSRLLQRLDRSALPGFHRIFGTMEVFFEREKRRNTLSASLNSKFKGRKSKLKLKIC